mmetsp:Transcript_13099/g.39656  ORF Transcript_13099/g.39656 Transcript_13099/m.39656 type:complete len:442 (-) Transcript_13099:685-2010(-)|eukprot:CAMPEP_0206137532 /NCGR_PEP_ID=MMETSP1473-20131121/2641_1 /ASSEMBLY_ACC=CAM_ASM_001109 /TAXON_ID=1461547 /ORGANISM="Stichococcus sp, Strain RCC1054" /LENGTH=441 /DNA_ID=CAMNT_0053530667 /DNA_START=247 /DNA_END=1572 /DNA_ORIENTATION=-
MQQAARGRGAAGEGPRRSMAHNQLPAEPVRMDGGPWGGSGSLDDMGVDVDVLDMVAMGNRFREHLMSPPLDAADVSGPMASPVLRRNRWPPATAGARRRLREPPLAGPTNPPSFRSNARFGTLGTFLDQPSTVEHWQLRDLLSYSEDETGRPHLYTVEHSYTVAIDIATRQATRSQLLSYKPTSMTVGEGCIATGGTSGQVEVRSLDGSFSFKGNTRGSVNNALHICPDGTGKAQLFVANNDQTIKVHALPDMGRTAVIQTETAINSQSLHPDARRLAAVGDTPHLYMFEAAEAGWRQTSSRLVAGDAGMCCAWAPAGDALAAAYQDGMVLLWDTRSMEVTATLQCGVAARCVKFSGGPADMLAIAEHKGAAHIVDLRNTAKVQTVRPAGPGRSPHDAAHISGLAFTPAGRQLYIGLENCGIACVDIDVLSRRTFSDGALC